MTSSVPTVTTPSPDDWWRALRDAAEQARSTGLVFHSPIRGQRYRITDVDSDRVTVDRIDGDEPAVLTRAQVERAVNKIEQAGGRLSRRSLSHTVAEETAMVALHPALRWDDAKEWIELVLTGTASVVAPRPLHLYDQYTRCEVHDIFAPDAPFTPQTGTWGLQGIVRLPNRDGDYVFFVTFGKRQGNYVFEESITADGVLTWQSQPRQELNDPWIRDFVAHDETINSIHLFLRTRGADPYSYLGQLKYLTHDHDRERPVHFKWQIIPAVVPDDVAGRIGLPLDPATREPNRSTEPIVVSSAGLLIEIPAPAVLPRVGERTPEFRGHLRGDYGEQDAKNRKLGRDGELLVCRAERDALRAAGRPDLAEQVRHVAELEGDGAGYDVASFTPNGEQSISK